MWNSIDQKWYFGYRKSGYIGIFLQHRQVPEDKTGNLRKRKFILSQNSLNPFFQSYCFLTFSDRGNSGFSHLGKPILQHYHTSFHRRDIYIGRIVIRKMKYSVQSEWICEFLAYAGFSYQLLAILLSITFIVLILNFSNR